MLVRNTSKLPYSAACFVFDTKAGTIATGTLISPSHLLTSEYVFPRRRVFEGVRVYPGGQPNESAFGSSQVTQVWVHDRLAIAKLAKPLGGKAGYLPVVQLPDATLRDLLVNVVGFAATDPSSFSLSSMSMWVGTGKIEDVTTTELINTIFDAPGMGGGPLISSPKRNQFQVVGVHYAENQGVRTAVRISDAALHFIRNAMSQ